MRGKLLSILLLVALLLPTPAHAAGQLQIDSVVAGLEAQARLSGFGASQSMEVHVVSPSGGDTSLPVRTDASGAARVSIPGTFTEEAGAYRAFAAADRTKLTGDVHFEVYPDRLDPQASQMEANTKEFPADGTSEARVTVTLRDAFGNPLSGRPVSLVASRTADTIVDEDRQTDARGVQHFAVRSRKPGEIILRAMDLLSGTTLDGRVTLTASDPDGRGGNWDGDESAAPTPARNPLVAQAGAAGGSGVDHFDLSVSPKTPKTGEVINVTIRAVAADGSTAEDYVGTIRLSSPSDPTINLPGFGESRGQITFVPKNLGVKLLPLSVSFSQDGPQTLVAEDVADGLVRGETVVLVAASEGGSDGKRIEVLSHKDGQQISEPNILVEGIGPVYSNLIVTGGTQDVQGETDSKGHFSLPVDLDLSYNEYTIRVRDDSRGYDSGPIHLIRDNQGPDVSFTLDPEQATQDADITATVLSEPHLPEVLLRVANREYALTESPGEPGTYSVMIKAQAAGKYQPAIIAKDDAGNTTEVRGQLTILQPDVPTVQNLRAQPKANGIDLHWDLLQGEKVESYLVYVGTGAQSFYATLDTKQPRDGAAVMGLQPGVTYYFAVTAKVGGRESAEKSEVASASPLGLSLQVTPQEKSLLLQWTFPAETSLSAYQLEYGVEDGKYPEKRLLQGEQHAYVMRDLLDGVTYYIRLTPVAVNGDLLTDLTATAQAKPRTTVAGFQPSASDPVPFEPSTAPGNGLHAAAPATPGSGLSTVALWGVAAASVLGFAWYWRRKRSTQLTEEFLRMMGQRYHS